MSAVTEFEFERRTFVVKGASEQDWIFKSIVRTGTFYELDLLLYMRFALREHDGIILDAGANIGNHSIFFGAVMEAAVACFEPNPPVFAILEDNLAANDVTHKTYKLGLGASQGLYVIDFKHEGAVNNIGAARLVAGGDGEVTVKRLDDIIDEISDGFGGKELIAIKADIEGMEPEMLMGAILTLERYKPDLFIEISTQPLMTRVEAILQPIGYVRLYSNAATPVWHFSHNSKLPITRRIGLWIFRHSMKMLDLPRRARRLLERFV